MFYYPLDWLSFSLLLVLLFCILYVVIHIHTQRPESSCFGSCEWAILSVQVLKFQHPKLIQDVFFPFRFIVFQLRLGAFLLFRFMLQHIQHPELIKDVLFPLRLTVFQPLFDAVLKHSLCCNTHKHIHTRYFKERCRPCGRWWCEYFETCHMCIPQMQLYIWAQQGNTQPQLSLLLAGSVCPVPRALAKTRTRRLSCWPSLPHFQGQR